MGQIITFYSYKGGVGRSMALANIACLLASWKYDVLVVDWDLEAPGLEYFFDTFVSAKKVSAEEGLVDLFNEYIHNPNLTRGWRDYLVRIPLRGNNELHMITSGKRDDKYFERLKEFDIQTFYTENEGGYFIENMREEWKAVYDFVLVDSRTGITDIGGICTIQLPDILLLLFTATNQSLQGVIEVAQKAASARQKLPYDRLTLVSVPIPTRFEALPEFKISNEWLDRFARELEGLYATWLPYNENEPEQQRILLRQLLDIIKIPYVPYFSFGESLPVVEQSLIDPKGLSYTYVTLTALLANNLSNIDLLPEQRDEFVRQAQEGVKSPPSKPTSELDQAEQMRAEIQATLNRKLLRDLEQGVAGSGTLGMGGHLFISYSSADGVEFSFRLHDTLEAGPPHIPAWLDRRDISAGHDWDVEIDNAIASCGAFLFVMTPDSVEDNSVCRLEWSRALRYKKAVVPLLLTRGVNVPFRLESRQHIDFTGNFDQAMAKLRQHIAFLKSPVGELQRMKDQRADAQRDLRRADDSQRARIQDEIAQLDADIAKLQAIVDDPAGAAQRQQASIDARIEQVRQPASAPRTTTKFINSPPGIAPDYFQDRHVETQLVANFLNNPSQRLLTIVGRGGVGKTAMVCRLLKGLEIGKLPDDLGEMKVDGIVYLSAIGSRRVNFANLYADLAKLLPPNIADELDALYREPQISAAAKTERLLTHFPEGRHVVLLDNMEDGIDPESRHLTDSELDEALRAMLDAPHHGIKVVITTRLNPRQLTTYQPGRQHKPLELDAGLESPYAENILRAMDDDGKLGLKNAPDALLNRARERTRGYPRALEALAAILAADWEITLEEMLDADLPENVVEALVGQAYSRLDTTAQRVMQALAIFGRPVPTVAVDYLLQPYQPGFDSAGTLGRLVGMHFARREAGQYFLDPVDQAYALDCIPKGDPMDRYEQGDPQYTRYALYDRAANYFAQSRKPRAEWKTIVDLAPQLAEIDLRITGEDYDTAARVLTDSDYLLLWGQYKLMIALHERLQGKISDSTLKRISVGNLGQALAAIGQVRRAISCYETALDSARENHNRQGEGVWLGNLGNAYSDLGEVRKAITYYEQALQIARDIGDKRNEGADLGSLGSAYKYLGNIPKAIEYMEQALQIAREIGDKRGEGARLGALGNHYAELGETEKAIAYYEQAIAVEREIGNRQNDSIHTDNLGSVYLDLGRITDAKQQHQRAIEIADEIGFAPMLNFGRFDLAKAHLAANELKSAQEAIAAARTYDEPRNNHNVHALAGVIAARLGDWSGAVSSFQEAVRSADDILAKTAEYFEALDAKGLALAGLAVCAVKNHPHPPAPSPQNSEGEASPASATPLPMFGEGQGVGFSAAIAAYRAARAIISAKGTVNRVLRLHDELAVVAEGDAALMAQLAEVRQAAAGEA